MRKVLSGVVVALVALAAPAPPAHAQVNPPRISNPDWVKPFPPFRIVGGLYYVGTYKARILFYEQLFNAALLRARASPQR